MRALQPAGLLLLAALLPSGWGLSCYQCRSDEVAECGDPFVSNRVGRKECDLINTISSRLCYKITQFAGGRPITVRGCSAFDNNHFPEGLQRAMVGDYWKVQTLSTSPSSSSTLSSSALSSP